MVNLLHQGLRQKKIPLNSPWLTFNQEVTDLDARKAPGKELDNLRDPSEPGIEYLYYNSLWL